MIDRRLSVALNEERRAQELASATPGLGTLQALREIQAQRYRNNNTR